MLPSSKNSDEIHISGGWRIRPVEEFHFDIVKHICLSIDDLETKDSVIYLKSTPDKKVLLLVEDTEPLLIKTHLHQSIGNQLKTTLRYLGGGKKRTTYLLREFENTSLAQRSGVPTSQIYGYGIFFKKGLVNQELLLSSGSPNTMPLIESLRKQAENEKEIDKILQRTFNLISRMLKAGYVHLDLHSDNILLSNAGPEKDIIIDHEFGSLFPEDKLLEVAAFVFGYLYRCQVREYISFKKYTAIVTQALPSLDIEVQQLNPSFEDWFHFAATQRVAKKSRRNYLRL